MLEKAEQPIESQAEIKEVETAEEPAISSRSLKKPLFSMVPNRFLFHPKKNTCVKLLHKCFFVTNKGRRDSIWKSGVRDYPIYGWCLALLFRKTP